MLELILNVFILNVLYTGTVMGEVPLHKSLREEWGQHLAKDELGGWAQG